MNGFALREAGKKDTIEGRTSNSYYHVVIERRLWPATTYAWARIVIYDTRLQFERCLYRGYLLQPKKPLV